MRKTIELSNRAIALESNAATPLVAKRVFKIDFFTYFQDISSKDVGERSEAIMRLAFVMCKQAEVSATLPGASEQLAELLKLTEDDFLAWSVGIEFDDMINTLLPQALDLWMGNNKTNSSPKNLHAPQ